VRGVPVNFYGEAHADHADEQERESKFVNAPKKHPGTGIKWYII